MHPGRAEPIDGWPGVAVDLSLHPEEQARADLYALVARLLFAAPDAPMLQSLAAADAITSQQADHPLDISWEKLVAGAALMDALAVADEFDALFISTGTPRINPYGSFYLTGHLNDAPLAALRTDLARFRLTRVREAAEMEDHLGALSETMRVLITGAAGSHAQALALQRQFFATHIAPWYQRCLDDIRAVNEANFYRLVADFVQAFFDVETEAFELGEASLAGQAQEREFT